MELYLDSVNFNEIEAAARLGFVTGLTTTPTFMHRDGITDIDAGILKLSKMVPVLQVEALGDTAEDIQKEAHRLLQLGLSPEKTVFKIPVSMEGARACHMLVSEGLMVNIHLVYTLQQAYIAMQAGATYVCPLVGRLQDQGHDALGLVKQCVEATERFGYNSKIMFSSVRHPEHVKNAITLGVHTCTIPWKVMKQLTENHFTAIGTQQFTEHTRLLTTTVKEVARQEHTTLANDKTVLEALMRMTQSQLGAVTILNASSGIHRIFTDGDLRRMLNEQGEGVLQQPLSSLEANQPVTLNSGDTLFEASNLFRDKKVDSIIVEEDGRPIGIIDVHDVL